MRTDRDIADENVKGLLSMNRPLDFVYIEAKATSLWDGSWRIHFDNHNEQRLRLKKKIRVRLL